MDGIPVGVERAFHKLPPFLICNIGLYIIYILQVHIYIIAYLY